MCCNCEPFLFSPNKNPLYLSAIFLFFKKYIFYFSKKYIFNNNNLSGCVNLQKKKQKHWSAKKIWDTFGPFLNNFGNYVFFSSVNWNSFVFFGKNRHFL
jgi:hypothetical protein